MNYNILRDFISHHLTQEFKTRFPASSQTDIFIDGNNVISDLSVVSILYTLYVLIYNVQEGKSMG